jgi:predicted nucleic acid-binding protein
MVAAVVESTVLVDLLRDHAPAVQWFQRQIDTTFGTTPIIWMEIVGGGQNKAERMRAARLMKQFEMIFPTPADFEWAMRAQMNYELSHGTGMMDCLIASASNRLRVPLFTHNLKHFSPLIEELARKPY